MLVELLLLACSEESSTIYSYEAKSSETHVLNLIRHPDLIIKRFMKSFDKQVPAHEACDTAV